MVKINTILLSCILLLWNHIVTAQNVYVSSATQLQSALNNAVAGQTIIIQDGYYERPGGFYANAGIDGTAANPITVIGSRNVVLSTNNLSSGYAFSLKGNKYWIIKGFTVTTSKNGVVLDNCKYVTIDSIYAKKLGQDGVHLRTHSSYCIVKNCFIDSTGLNDYSYGEGVYIGSAYSNWCTYTNCDPDTSNYNQVLNNTFGNFVTAENIDIKEGTKYGIIRGNTFNGTGLQGLNGGDSWIDAKGNYYTIENNTGTNTILDGFQTHIAQPGWGNYNIFRNNTINLNGPGYGVRVQTSNANGTAANNQVCNNNTVSGAGLGMANVSTVTCTTVFPAGLLAWNATRRNEQLLFEWEVSTVAHITRFMIEASEDGKNFVLLSTVAAGGTKYQQTLAMPLNTPSYFRLGIRNKDGSTTYSGVVQLKDHTALLKFYFDKQQLIIHYHEQSGSMALYTVAGQKLADRKLVNGFNYVSVPPFQGIAIINVNDGRNQFSRRLMNLR